MRFIRVAVSGILCAALLPAAVTEVSLSPSASPASADPVVTVVTVIGHGFPKGTIPPANVTVTLAPSVAGAGPTGTTPASKITVASGTTERVNFQVPKSIGLTAATPYLVTIAGSTQAGAQFKSSNFASLTIYAPVAITTTALATGTAGTNYAQSLSATGGSGGYTWQLSGGSLPGGLSLNATTGLISGQPSASGLFHCEFKVTDSDSSSTSKAFTLSVNPALVITTASPLPPGTVNVTYAEKLTATGGSGPYTWSIVSGSLPSGLSLNAATGAISGVPATAGIPTFTIAVTDTNQASASKAFSLTIDPALSITSTSPLPSGQAGIAYSETLTAAGGSGQYTWSVTAGSLPAALTLTAATGVLAGTPSTAGTANFTIQVTDSNQATATRAFSLTVNPAAVIQSLAPNTAPAGVSLQVTITGSNTHFVQGTTEVTFGSGVTVSRVTVDSATSALAQIAIASSAAPGSRTVTALTGAEQASLVNGFTIAAAIPIVNVNTATATPLSPGFSGFDDEYLINGVEYWDPKFTAMVAPLKPGWIRYPAGTPSIAFDWQSSHENLQWMSTLAPKIGTYFTDALKLAQQLTQAKGGAAFNNYGTFLQTLGANGIVAFNGFTDGNPDSAYKMVMTAAQNGSNIVEWEIDNEPYVFSTIFPAAADYAASAYSPYFQNIVAANPNATAGVFYQGAFNWQQGNYQAWDSGMSAYSPQYWNGVSLHVYPLGSTTLGTPQIEQTLNGILAHGTTEYFSSYIQPLIGASMPVFITELNSGSSDLAFESYLYNGVFLAEYVARMSAIPQVKAVGVSELYLGNSYNQGMIRAVNDFEQYLLAQIQKNPNYSTDTASNPATQFVFYYSTGALAMEIANQAINGSSGAWSTAVYGSPTVPILGYDGNPIPAVYAQGYAGAAGTHYLLVTNKSASSIPIAIEAEGNFFQTNLQVSYISNASDTAQNTASAQNTVQIVNTTSPNPVTLGPFSVTRIQW